MRLTKHASNQRRSEEGSSFIEVGIASVAMAVIVFLAMDAYVWMQAFMLNDIACRDACRAAAQASSTTNTPVAYKAAAKSAAIAELALHSVSRPYIGFPTFVDGGYVWQDYGASNGNNMPAQPQTPFVRVQTSMNVNLPIPLNAFGGLQAKPLVFQRSYSMPIVNLPPP